MNVIPIFKDKDGHYYRATWYQTQPKGEWEGSGEKTVEIPEDVWYDYVNIRSLYETTLTLMDSYFDPEKFTSND